MSFAGRKTSLLLYLYRLRPHPSGHCRKRECLILRSVFIRQIHDRHLALDGFAERNNCFRAGKSKRLELVVNDVQQVMVVSRVNLDKHVVLTGRKMTLHYLGNLFQSFSHGVKLLRIFQIQTDVCTGFIPHLLRIDDKFRAFQIPRFVNFCMRW